ncbi:MAG: hypothetical protein HY835_10680 [Anaerolineae bacterium]|nr:hypothetical protein [Anaerolineae bacterium]
MAVSTARKGFPVISVFLFVCAGIAFILSVYFVIAAFSAPHALDGVEFVLVNALGPIVNAVIGPAKQALGGAMILLAVISLLVTAILTALGVVLRNHRDLAARVAALEARLATLEQ